MYHLHHHLNLLRPHQKNQIHHPQHHPQQVLLLMLLVRLLASINYQLSLGYALTFVLAFGGLSFVVSQRQNHPCETDLVAKQQLLMCLSDFKTYH